jgi:N-acyl homoserine lactone hydrolase
MSVTVSRFPGEGMSTKYTIKPILTGWQYLDKGLYATFRDGLGTILEHPVFAWLVEGGGHKYLVDTGMGSTEVSQKYHHDGRQDSGTAIHEQLAKLGVATDEIEAIIFTHLHWDHCYNMKEFKKARYIASDAEYAFARDPIPPYWNSYEHEKAGLTPPFKGCTFELIAGEKEVFDGIHVIPTPGHSPGHIAVAIDTEKGSHWIIGDLMLVRENLKPDKKRGWPLTPIGRFSNFVDLWHSMEKVVAGADVVLMTHDPSHLGVPIYPAPGQ